MSVITQWDGESALMMAVREGWTEVVSLLLKAGANTDLQNKVFSLIVQHWRRCGLGTSVLFGMNALCFVWYSVFF